MQIISRTQWGARHGDGRYWTELPADEVWLHHSVTIAPDVVPPFDDDDAAIRTIERIGRERFGEVYGFPYTFGVTPVGRIYEGHRINKTGAHTAGHNTRGRAICLVGDYEAGLPTEEMLDAVAWLLRHGAEQGWWRHAQLTGGHRDVKATACPGVHAYELISEINRRAAAPEEDIVASIEDLRRVVREEVMDAQVDRKGSHGGTGKTSLRTWLAWFDHAFALGRATGPTAEEIRTIVREELAATHPVEETTP